MPCVSEAVTYRTAAFRLSSFISGRRALISCGFRQKARTQFLFQVGSRKRGSSSLIVANALYANIVRTKKENAQADPTAIAAN